MDASIQYVTRDELWRLQGELRSILVANQELVERVVRLERRQDDDARMKSVWGHSSSFPGVLSGTPQLDTGYNPAAEAFRNFDQDQTSSVLGSLHLDTEEEPRRGTSRANSVRFDESALHGHPGHTSRSSSELFPLRTSSAFGSHPFIERSSSHKSDGRQSSGSQSAQSTGLNSLRQEPRSPGLPVTLRGDPNPGRFLLGPLPSIIRCWLDTSFSTESLLYAVVCSGSYKSTLSSRVVEKLGLADKVLESNNARHVTILVYLPEATVDRPQNHPIGPAPQLPVVNIMFEVIDEARQTESIDIVIGSDVLCAKNADILFSQSKLTLLDDERNRLEVPFVQPEKVGIFQPPMTLNAPEVENHAINYTTPTSSSLAGHSVYDPVELQPPDSPTSQISRQTKGGSSGTKDAGYSTLEPVGNYGRVEDVTIDCSQIRPQRTVHDSVLHNDTKNEQDERLGDSPATGEQYGLNGSWRRDTASPRCGSFSSVASGSTLAKSTRGKAMKILRPSRSIVPRSSAHSLTGSATDIQSSRWPRVLEPENQRHFPSRRNAESDEDASLATMKPPANATALLDCTLNHFNPIGDGSAFGWLSAANST